MFDKILIANRGEIALRIQRACRELGIPTVAVHSTADADAMHVRLADESVCIGPPPARDSYLNIAGDPVGRRDHRGRRDPSGLRLPVGERRLRRDGRGARPHLHRPVARAYPHDGRQDRGQGGDGRARRAAGAGLGRRGRRTWTRRGAVADADRLSGADQGRGRRRRARHEGRARAPTSSRKPGASRGPRPGPRSATTRSISRNTSTGPRHIELQVLADNHGNVVHFGERDCSLQRRHQKLLEEAGSPALDAAARDALGATVTAGLRKLGYRNAGTLEFLYQDGQFAFIEMNTRLQVEHPVTEMVCGIDLVREQIRIAAGQALGYAQADIALPRATPSSAGSTPRTR